MPAKINPRKLRGPWTDGYALDVHTTSSTMIGHNAYGHAVFDTVRSPLISNFGTGRLLMFFHRILLNRPRSGLGDQAYEEPVLSVICIDGEKRKLAALQSGGHRIGTAEVEPPFMRLPQSKMKLLRHQWSVDPPPAVLFGYERGQRECATSFRANLKLPSL